MRSVSVVPDPASPAASSDLLRLLSGGDRRSIMQGERVHSLVTRTPSRIAELVELAQHGDVLVSMRALDVLDKLAHEHPAWVQPYRKLFIGPLAESAAWEVRLQIVRTLSLLDWTRLERQGAIAILRRNLEHPRLFVRAWALDSLARLSARDAALLRIVEHELARFESSGSRALEARARHIRKRLAARRASPSRRGRPRASPKNVSR